MHFSSQVVDTVDEYFNSGDVKETAASMLVRVMTMSRI